MVPITDPTFSHFTALTSLNVESSSREPCSEPVQDVTCHMGSHSVTCHPTQVNATSLNPSHKVVDLPLPIPEGWKAELIWVVDYIPRQFTCPETVTNPSSNGAWHRATTITETSG